MWYIGYVLSETKGSCYIKILTLLLEIGRETLATSAKNVQPIHIPHRLGTHTQTRNAIGLKVRIGPFSKLLLELSLDEELASAHSFVKHHLHLQRPCTYQ